MFEIGFAVDDHLRVAPELHCAAIERIGRQLLDELVDARRAREGHLFRNWRDAMRCSETSEGKPKTTFSKPSGTPASWNQREIAIAVPGVSSAGLSMIEQQAPSITATFWTTLLAGKLQAASPITGLTESFSTNWRRPESLPGTTRP